MDKFLEQIAEILEVDEVKLTDVLVDFETWDSLSQLSIIALAGESYNVMISAAEIRNIKTIEDLKNLIDNKK